MVIGFLWMVLLLADSVVFGKNECAETFTEPGNISNKGIPSRTGSSDRTVPNPDVVYCEYFIKAPRNSYIEFNFTAQAPPQHVLQPQRAAPPSTTTAPTTWSYSARPVLDTSRELQRQLLPSAASPSSTPLPSHPYAHEEQWAPTPVVKCISKLMVVEVTSSGREKPLRRLCIQDIAELESPQVFSSGSPLIKLNYSWETGHAPSFKLSFVFHKWPSPCEHHCDDGSCLPDGALVCNYVSDCLDQSDETNCPPRDDQIGSDHFIEVVVIVVVVVFTLGVVSCVFFHYRLTSRLWRERHHDNSSAEHHHLNPPTHQSTEVVYVPSTPLDRVEREVALQRERQRRLQAIQTDMELNLPPAISISEDGEEGYAESQRQLQISCQQRRPGGSIRPPPNKTVFQGDSPPPYRSNSVSKLEGHYHNKRSGGGGLHQSFPPACLTSKHSQQACGGNSPYIPRCHSISSGDKRLPSYSSHQSRGHSVLPSCGHVARCAGTIHGADGGHRAMVVPCGHGVVGALDGHSNAAGNHSQPVGQQTHSQSLYPASSVPAHSVTAGGAGVPCGAPCPMSTAASGAVGVRTRGQLSIQLPPHCNDAHAAAAPVTDSSNSCHNHHGNHIVDLEQPPDYSEAMRQSVAVSSILDTGTAAAPGDTRYNLHLMPSERAV